MIDNSNLELFRTDIMVWAAGEEADKPCGDQCAAIFWTKFAFVFFCFIQAMIGGLIPVYVDSCRTNPKIFGVANAFAAGVFLAISLVHMLPEEIEAWSKYRGHEGAFPLPEALCFAGYTMIMLFDKVMFDTHAMFDENQHGHAHDPADAHL